MRFKKLIAAFVAVLFIVPASASAAITLTPAGQAQLAQLATQLVAIFSQIAQAQALGTSYTQSAAFQAQALTWTTQLVQIQQQLSALIVSSAQNTPTITPVTNIPTLGGTPNSCPNFYRPLGIGDQGSDVAAMQLFLARETVAKYVGGITGMFDSSTEQAVQRYQAGYGIVYYGSPDSTGYGKVGPSTRASMAAICARGPIIISVPPITVPINQLPINPSTPTTVQTGYSTAQISIIPSLTGQSGGPNSVTFSVNLLPNSTCTSAGFVLSFGDGNSQALSSNASCGNQIVQVPHVYSSAGPFTATLASGTFTVSLPVSIQAANNNLTLSAIPDTGVSLGSIITITYNPGSTCVAGSYTINFGDGNSQALTFSSGCSAQTQTIKHTYSLSQQYLITGSDSAGHTVTATVTPVIISSAGAGDPFQVLLLHGDGSSGSTAIVDSSPKAHAMTPGGNAHSHVGNSVLGGGSIYVDGSSYVATPASQDFNFGNGPFTMDMWFNPHTFPASNGQAALLMQAAQNAADTTLGGIGLELFGDQLYFVGSIGNVTYHPFYNNTLHTSHLRADTWYHVAVTRSGNLLSMYINGVSTSTIAVSGSANASANALTVGRYGEYPGNYFNGWIDELDIAKGTARWTSNFTPVGSPSTPPPSPTPPAPTLVSGLKGDFYNGINFDQFIGSTVDQTINFSDATQIGSSRAGGGATFSARWSGFFTPAFSEAYTFYTVSDDGVRLSIGNTSVINNWTVHGAVQNTGTVSLTAGTPYPIILDFFNGDGPAAIQLMYSSPHIGKTVIPSSDLAN